MLTWTDGNARMVTTSKSVQPAALSETDATALAALAAASCSVESALSWMPLRAWPGRFEHFVFAAASVNASFAIACCGRGRSGNGSHTGTVSTPVTKSAKSCACESDRATVRELPQGVRTCQN